MSKDGEKVHHTNTNQKKAGVATLTSNKMTSNSSKTITDKEEYYIKDKEINSPRRYNNPECV